MQVFTSMTLKTGDVVYVQEYSSLTKHIDIDVCVSQTKYWGQYFWLHAFIVYSVTVTT